MITMKMQGGLGNQMFQFATGYAIAKKLGVELALDISSYAHDPLRRFNLDLFRIDNKIVFDSKPTIVELGLSYNSFLFQVRWPEAPYSRMGYQTIADGDVISGYFQDERYFSEYRDDLMKIFMPHKPLSPVYESYFKSVRRANSVALTIRRGDYLQKQEYHGVLGSGYYGAALHHTLHEKSNSMPLDVFVFSDDIEWCKKNAMSSAYISSMTFINNDMTTRDHKGREDADIWLMKHCRAHILANSTFSWWGAYLSGSNRVVAPRNWYADKSIKHSIIPERWQQL